MAKTMARFPEKVCQRTGGCDNQKVLPDILEEDVSLPYNLTLITKIRKKEFMIMQLEVAINLQEPLVFAAA